MTKVLPINGALQSVNNPSEAVVFRRTMVYAVQNDRLIQKIRTSPSNCRR
jgi:hypothetical protein